MSGNSTYSFTVLEEMYSCFNSTAGTISITIFSIIDIAIILPLCMIVLYLGFQQWRQQNPNTPMSHCDVLTYNMVLTDLLQVTGSLLSCYSIHADVSGLLSAGVWMLSFYLSGQSTLFPLTCVDYYLATVFPIVYLSLRKPKLIRIRNITIGCIWASNVALTTSFGFLGVKQIIRIVSVFASIILLFVIFSCFSVLYSLIRPGPGEGGRRKVNQSKLKAFNIIAAILMLLTFRFLGATVCNSLYEADGKACVATLFVLGSSLLCSFLQPILFLQRTGKLSFYKHSN